jgi:hypothetical protein
MSPRNNSNAIGHSPRLASPPPRGVRYPVRGGEGIVVNGASHEIVMGDRPAPLPSGVGRRLPGR